MKIAIDPGHGMGNKSKNKYDPGAVCKDCKEAEVAMAYGLTLKYLLTRQDVETFLTRTSDDEAAPLKDRVSCATAAGCDCLVSLHLNSAENIASGLEVLYRNTAKDKPLADALQRKLTAVTGFRCRGSQPRTDLGVLKFAAGPAVLIELGFINNTKERTFLLNRENRIAVCKAIMETILG